MTDYFTYLTSPEWAARRKAEFAKAKGACTGCGRRPQNIHHRTYDRLGNEAEGDLVALCKRCHLLAHLQDEEHPGMGLWEATNATIRSQRELAGLPAILLPAERATSRAATTRVAPAKIAGKAARKAAAKEARRKRGIERRAELRQRRWEAFFAKTPEHVSLAEIEAARTPAGGWTRKQMTAWGVPWPPPKGWKAHLTGEMKGGVDDAAA